MDRAPTREDIHASRHWQTECVLRRAGFDPAHEDIGRESALTGGRRRPRTRVDEPPPEKRFRYDPMPLAWFDNAPARAVLRAPDPEHELLELLCAGRLAGYWDGPSRAEIFRMLVEGIRNEGERMTVAELLCDIREEVYPMLRRQDALSIRHIARGALSWWLNQYAEKPASWPGDIPGGDR